MAMSTVFVRCFDGRRSILTFDHCPVGSEEITHEVVNRLRIPHDFLQLYHRGQSLKGRAIITDMSTVEACLTLVGGKGGFGSMLRALGAQIERTTNREACRDLSGRRMRDVNAQKQIAEWVSREAEREQQKADAKKQKLERLLAKPHHKFDDKEYTNQLQQTAERLHDSVRKGLASTSEAGHSGTGKRPASASTGTGSKRMKGWLGVENLDDSSEDSESESNVNVVEEETIDKKDREDGKDLTSNEQALDPNSKDLAPENDQPLQQQSGELSQDSGESLCGSHNNNKDSCPLKTDDSLPIDLMEFSSAKELEMVGRLQIKAALKSMGLKFGGTLQQLAERLFATKDVK